MKITGTIFKDSDTPLWAMAASFIALISAFGFQYLGGMALANFAYGNEFLMVRWS